MRYRTSIYPNSEERLIDRLSNFFVAMTKVNHVSHTIVMTPDTFFVENVYIDSSLKNDETAVRIMTQEGVDEKTARDVIDRVDGLR